MVSFILLVAHGDVFPRKLSLPRELLAFVLREQQMKTESHLELIYVERYALLRLSANNTEFWFTPCTIEEAPNLVTFCLERFQSGIAS